MLLIEAGDTDIFKDFMNPISIPAGWGTVSINTSVSWNYKATIYSQHDRTFFTKENVDFVRGKIIGIFYFN